MVKRAAIRQDSFVIHLFIIVTPTSLSTTERKSLHIY